MNDPIICTVCLDEIKITDSVMTLKCTHIFHGMCILPWFIKHNTCPNCINTITDIYIVNNDNNTNIKCDDTNIKCDDTHCKNKKKKKLNKLNYEIKCCNIIQFMKQIYMFILFILQIIYDILYKIIIFIYECIIFVYECIIFVCKCIIFVCECIIINRCIYNKFVQSILYTITRLIPELFQYKLTYTAIIFMIYIVCKDIPISNMRNYIVNNNFSDCETNNTDKITEYKHKIERIEQYIFVNYILYIVNGVLILSCVYSESIYRITRRKDIKLFILNYNVFIIHITFIHIIMQHIFCITTAVVLSNLSACIVNNSPKIYLIVILSTAFFMMTIGTTPGAYYGSIILSDRHSKIIKPTWRFDDESFDTNIKFLSYSDRYDKYIHNMQNIHH